MAVDERIIDRIRKLLALAGDNPNEHEAAAAAAKAQALMQEHDLAAADVSVKTDARTAGITQAATVLRQRGKPGSWKEGLFSAVAETSDCWAWSTSTRGSMLGRERDVEMAEYLFAYLVRELERLQHAYGATRWDELKAYARQNGISTHTAESHYSARGRHPLRAKDSWIRGAVESVIRTLREQKAERTAQAAKAGALVVHKEQEKREYWAKMAGFASWADYIARRGEKTLKGKDLERALRQAERDFRKEQRARDRLDARTDWHAYERGVEDGRAIAPRPGVRGGSTAEPDLL